MKEKPNMDARLAGLLVEAAEWRMISLLFDCPVEEWSKDVAELAGEIRDPKLQKASKRALEEATEGTYHSIFGPGGPAPGREVSYRTWVQPGYLISEITAFYNAFSFTPRTLETPDHVSVEAGFISYLKLKEAFALSFADAENAGITAAAARTFTESHLVKIAEPLAKSLSASGVDYLSIAAETLLERTGPDKDKKVREFLPVLSDSEDEIFECGITP